MLMVVCNMTNMIKVPSRPGEVLESDSLLGPVQKLELITVSVNIITKDCDLHWANLGMVVLRDACVLVLVEISCSPLLWL